MSIVGPANLHHYLELRGAVGQFDLYRTLDFVNRLFRKYPGQPMNPEEDGQERYRLTVEIDSWTGQ